MSQAETEVLKLLCVVDGVEDPLVYERNKIIRKLRHGG